MLASAVGARAVERRGNGGVLGLREKSKTGATSARSLIGSVFEELRLIGCTPVCRKTQFTPPDARLGRAEKTAWPNAYWTVLDGPS